MTSCQPYELALLDEAEPRPEGFEAHLASCEPCQKLARAHRLALRLRGMNLTPSRRPHRQVVLRAGLLAGVVLVVGGALGWLSLNEVERPGASGALTGVELSVPPVAAAEPEDDAAALGALAQLQAALVAELHKEARDDPTVDRIFGTLAVWTAPERTHPMRSLGKLASPVVFTSEDSP